MGQEIEKKYLLWENGIDYTDPSFLNVDQEEPYHSTQDLRAIVIKEGQTIKQGYLELTLGKKIAEECSLHLDFNPTEARLRDKSGKYTFTIKGEGSLTRNEAEMKIDSELFKKYWSNTSGKRVEKIRLTKPYNGQTLEIDVYTDRDLIVAEIEFPDEISAKHFPALGKDVTEDKNYKNKNLAK